MSKALTVLIIFIGCFNSIMLLLSPEWLSPRWFSQLSPAPRVFVQDGFFNKKTFTISKTNNTSDLIDYKNMGEDRMLYMLAMFANQIPEHHLQSIVYYEICYPHTNKKNTDLINEVQLVWHNYRGPDQRWRWNCK